MSYGSQVGRIGGSSICTTERSSHCEGLFRQPVEVHLRDCTGRVKVAIYSVRRDADLFCMEVTSFENVVPDRVEMDIFRVTTVNPRQWRTKEIKSERSN